MLIWIIVVSSYTMVRFPAVILCLLLLSCETKNIGSRPQISDTAKVLYKAVAMGTDGRHMPSASELKGRSHFGDTVLLTSKVLPIALLPQIVGTEKFKIMQQRELCAVLKQ